MFKATLNLTISQAEFKLSEQHIYYMLNPLISVMFKEQEHATKVIKNAGKRPFFNHKIQLQVDNLDEKVQICGLREEEGDYTDIG
jgi:Ca2+-dependent lipid-binding protein